MVMVYLLLVAMLCVSIKILITPKLYFNIETEKLLKFLYVLYFRGQVGRDILKNGKMTLEDVKMSKDHMFYKYYERGRFGLCFVVSLDEKSKKLEKLLTELHLDYYYNELNNAFGKYAIYIDLKNDFDSVIKLLHGMSDRIGIINEESDFNVRFFNLVNKPFAMNDYNIEDQALFERVQGELWLPATIGRKILDRVNMILVGK